MKRPSTVSQNVLVIVTATAIGALAMGCGGGNENPGNGACNVPGLFADPKHGCTTATVCHGGVVPAAGFDMSMAGWETHLVGGMPKADGGNVTYPSMCMGKGFQYLKPGVTPAQGLFLDKMNPAIPTPPCGQHMPQIFTPLTAAEFACVQTWADGLVAAAH